MTLPKAVFKNKFSKIQGFTLVEMLVVLAIIAIISGVVLMSMDKAKSQSRDKKRIADIKSLQLALEFYYAKNNAYPSSLGGLTGVAIPTDPLGGTAYSYVAWKKSSTATRCNSYHLGVKLENNNAEYLGDDSDYNSVSLTSDVICGAGKGFDGIDSATNFYYDVVPNY